MEIKKGISQMAEYPNKEINYVVPTDGKMYYVLNDGVLENGVVIATLNPKHVVDPAVACSDMGAFKEDGSVLIDFDKEDIKVINDDLLLAVKAIPETNQVLDTVSKESDAISKALIEDNMAIIESKLLDEMGDKGEVLFSNPFKEACVFKTDSYNNKIGIDCSFIGKNDTNLYFHDNVVNSDTVVISLGGAVVNDPPVIVEETAQQPKVSEPPVFEEEKEEEISGEPLDLKLDINDSILSGFNKPKEDKIEDVSIESNETEKEEAISEKEPTIALEDVEKEVNISSNIVPENPVEENFVGEESLKRDTTDNNKVLDNAIETMKKLIEETSRLKERINTLEEELAIKNKVLDEEETKKDTLNDLLDEAKDALNDLDNID